MDLSLIPLNDLMEEIDKRFDTVCILVRRQIDRNNDEFSYHIKDKVGCVGLMDIAKNGIEKQYGNNGKII